GVAGQGYGAVFRMDRSGNATVIHPFAYFEGDGIGPTGVVQGSDGALYGTLGAYGLFGTGLVFRLALPPPPNTVAAQPVIVVTSPTEPIYERDSRVFAEYTCLNSVTCSGDVANGAALDTSTPGPHSFTITATAFGNVTTAR